MTDGNCIARWEPGIGKTLVYSRSSSALELVQPHEPAARSLSALEPQIPPDRGVLGAPLKLFMSCTRACDLECPMCFARGRAYSQPQMSAHRLAEVVTQAGQMGVLEVRLTGGEPTVLPGFFRLVGLIDQAGMRASINTHGAYCEEFLARFIDSPIDDVRVSIDGPEEIHDALRGRGVFARAVHTVRALKAAGKRVRINMMVFRGNVDALEQMVSLAHEIGVGIRFCPMRAIGRAREPSFERKHVLSRAEWREIEQGLGARGLLKPGVACFSVEDTEDFSLCDGPDAGLEECQCAPWFTQMGVDPEGEAYAGGRIDDIDKSLSVGSVMDVPLALLWQQAVRDVVERVLPRFERCGDCSPPMLWEKWSARLARTPTSSRHLY